jgi:hypothetical protein
MKLEGQANKDVFPCQRAGFFESEVCRISLPIAASCPAQQQHFNSDNRIRLCSHTDFAATTPERARPCQTCAAVY